jgi:hypothetical protein|tara:strand:- start:84 stop:290 length:207 start_codon:yes stop_codon:yes gene_type:complete
MKKIDQIEEMTKLYEGTEIEGIKMELCISTEEVNALLSEYDPDDFNSPDIVTCRAIARLVLDALKSVQ